MNKKSHHRGIQMSKPAPFVRVIAEGIDMTLTLTTECDADIAHKTVELAMKRYRQNSSLAVIDGKPPENTHDD